MTVRLRWISVGTVAQWRRMEYAVRALKQATRDEVQKAKPKWTVQRIYRSTRVRMAAYIPMGDTASEGAKRVKIPNKTQFKPLREVGVDDFFQLLTEIMQYGIQAEFEDVEWTLMIELSSMQSGQSKNREVINIYKGIFDISKEIPDDISCLLAAFACGARQYLYRTKQCPSITNISTARYDVVKRVTDHLRSKVFKNEEDVMDLPPTSISRIVDAFPELRVVLLFPRMPASGFPFIGANFDEENDKENKTTVYILHAFDHYYGVTSPQALYRSLPGHKNNNTMWCKACLRTYNLKTGHECREPVNVYTKKKSKCTKCFKLYNSDKEHSCNQCKTCGRTKRWPHLCNHIWCRVCRSYRPEDQINEQHKCIVNMPLTERDVSSFCGEREREQYKAMVREAQKEMVSGAEEETAEAISDDSEWNVWAYDLEAALVFETATIDDYVEEVSYHQHRPRGNIHQCNLVIAKNIFTGQPLTFNNITDFLGHMLGTGKHIFIAHNGSGYDSRMILTEAIRVCRIRPKRVLFRGSRIMYLAFDNIVFLDSMLHLSGSLNALAKEFKLPTLKGYFPHRCNTPYYQNYNGPLVPLDEYIDKRFIGSKQDLVDLKNWYAEEEHKQDLHYGEQNRMQETNPAHVVRPYFKLRDELVKYCVNDVEILAKILLFYHNDISELTGLSPLRKATSAGIAHEIFLKCYLARYNANNVVINWTKEGKRCCEIMAGEPETETRKKEKCLTWCADSTWTVMNAHAYYFARDALRGGRTDIRRTILELTPDEIEDGETIKYIDIVSMYPYCQIAFDYPVGNPKISIFTKPDDMVGTTALCQQYFREDCNVSNKQPTMQRLKTFFGFIMCDVVPPKDLFHPVLVRFDRERKKCVASLEPLMNDASKVHVHGQRHVFTSVEFQVALEQGYTVGHVYMMHEYTRMKSLWSDMIKDLISLKIENSGVPAGYTEESLKKEYEDKFGMKLRRIEKNPAKKATYKRPATAAWGKCAETPDHMMTEIFMDDDLSRILEIEDKNKKNELELFTIQSLGDHAALYQYTENRDKVAPKLNETYIPAAVFVPAYGRLMLWKMMNRLGERVLMHDTDSIVYHSVPGEYDPPTGKILGDWELESCCDDGCRITSFLGLGPKSYAIKWTDRARQENVLMKCKGVSLKLAAQEQFNYEVMKDLIIGKRDCVEVDQIQFLQSPYRDEGRTRVWEYKKKISANDQVKGTLVGTTIYPFGYNLCAGCRDEQPGQEAHMDRTTGCLRG